MSDDAGIIKQTWEYAGGMDSFITAGMLGVWVGVLGSLTIHWVFGVLVGLLAVAIIMNSLALQFIRGKLFVYKEFSDELDDIRREYGT